MGQEQKYPLSSSTRWGGSEYQRKNLDSALETLFALYAFLHSLGPPTNRTNTPHGGNGWWRFWKIIKTPTFVQVQHWFYGRYLPSSRYLARMLLYSLGELAEARGLPRDAYEVHIPPALPKKKKRGRPRKAGWGTTIEEQLAAFERQMDTEGRVESVGSNGTKQDEVAAAPVGS